MRAYVALGVVLGLASADVEARASTDRADPVRTSALNDAEAVTTVVVSPIRVTGDLPAPRQVELAQALEAGLERGGFAIVGPDEEPSVAAAPYGVGLHVEIEGKDYVVTLEVSDRENGTSLARSREPCDVCGFAEVMQVVDSQAAAIVAQLEVLAREAPVLVFESVPDGAQIQVDGELVGATPFERVVSVGLHTVEARIPGYVLERRDVEAVPGMHAIVRFQLEASPRPPGRSKSLRAVGVSALSIGAAAILVGIPLIAIDGRPNTLDCSGANVDPLGNCKYLYATGVPGIALASVGGALVVTGIALLVAFRKRPSRANAALRRTEPRRQPL